MSDDQDQPRTSVSDVIKYIDGQIADWGNHSDQESAQYHIGILNDAKAHLGQNDGTGRTRNDKPSVALRKMIRSQQLASNRDATALGASDPVRELLQGGDRGAEDVNRELGIEPETPGQKQKQQIERGRTYDANRPVKAYDPSTPIVPGTPVQDPSTGQWGPGT